jgi:hypothetical protein
MSDPTTGSGILAIRHADRRGHPVLPMAHEAFIFFHGLGREHIDIEVTDSHQDRALEGGMPVSDHLQVPGDDGYRGWLGEIFLVTPSGGGAFFTWDQHPIPATATNSYVSLAGSGSRTGLRARTTY